MNKNYTIEWVDCTALITCDKCNDHLILDGSSGTMICNCGREFIMSYEIIEVNKKGAGEQQNDNS
jgi:hypothetical protein